MSKSKISPSKLGVIKEYPSDDEYDGDPSKIPISNPDLSAMNFNEHSIMGVFDKDEKGNIILLTNERGDLIDKLGWKVNEKGYLWDRYGNIVSGKNRKQRVFAEKQLNKGELPLPYSFDRYNFNPFEIMGNFDLDSNGKQKLLGKPKNWVDKNG